MLRGFFKKAYKTKSQFLKFMAFNRIFKRAPHTRLLRKIFSDFGAIISNQFEIIIAAKIATQESQKNGRFSLKIRMCGVVLTFRTHNRELFFPLLNTEWVKSQTY